MCIHNGHDIKPGIYIYTYTHVHVYIKCALYMYVCLHVLACVMLSLLKYRYMYMCFFGLHRHFWQIVREFGEQQKKQLLQFITGSDRIPLGGLAKLKFIIVKNGPDSDRLVYPRKCQGYIHC